MKKEINKRTSQERLAQSMINLPRAQFDAQMLHLKNVYGAEYCKRLSSVMFKEYHKMVVA